MSAAIAREPGHRVGGISAHGRHTLLPFRRRAVAVDGDVIHTLFAVNALGPIALIRAVLEHLSAHATIVGLTAVVAEHPTAGMAAYSASKSALSAYLAALRRERRRSGLTVLDVRPSHLDTGFETRALDGSPPDLPTATDHRDVVAQIIDAMRDDRRELAFDLRERKLVAR